MKMMNEKGRNVSWLFLLLMYFILFDFWGCEVVCGACFETQHTTKTESWGLPVRANKVNMSAIINLFLQINPLPRQRLTPLFLAPGATNPAQPTSSNAKHAKRKLTTSGMSSCCGSWLHDVTLYVFTCDYKWWCQYNPALNYCLIAKNVLFTWTTPSVMGTPATIIVR